MNTRRALSAGAVAVGIAVTGLVGVGTAVANAAGPSDIATSPATPTPPPVPGPPLSHHDQKKLDKYLKKHPEIAVPNTGTHP